MTAAWLPGTLYLPGANVRAVAAAVPIPVAITNSDFEAGASAWVMPVGSVGWSITSGGDVYAGTWSAKFDSTTGPNYYVNTDAASVCDVVPGQTLRAYCKIFRGPGAAGTISGAVVIGWFTAADVLISYSEGNACDAWAWQESYVQDAAPATAAKAKIGVRATRTSGAITLAADTFVWDASELPASASLIFRATQAAAATSGQTEPIWPTAAAGTVVDGGVTWTAVATSTVSWIGFNLMVTHNTTEPVWPTTVGAFVSDGTVSWECLGRNITDEKCPRSSKVVAIAASKIFAGDVDIVPFSATVNPLDWSTAQDAGYLPTGIQQANSNNVAVMNIYRSNVVVFNASTFQMWQVDPDPSAMALLDQMEGIGSTHQQAAQAVGDELFFLSQLGIRTVGVAVGSTNLSAGDIGAPIDKMVRPSIALSTSTGRRVVATYYPGSGQYWIAFPGDGT